MLIQPLTRPASPEQLDRLLRVVPSRSWMGLALLGAVLVAGLIWSAIATVPVQLQAQGVLLTPGGVADIVAPDNGRLVRTFVMPGDHVRAGQIVAEIDQPELAAELSKKQLEEAKLQERDDRIQGFMRQEGRATDTVTATSESGLRDRVEGLTSLVATYENVLKSQQDLMAHGFSTRSRVIDANSQLLSARAQLLDARQQLAQIRSATQTTRVKDDRERLDLQTALAGGRRDIDWIRRELGRRSRIVAPTDGTVVELAVNPGEMVSPSGPVMRILPGTGSRLVALLYVPPRSGRAVQIGMTAQIIPSTVQVQRDGFIMGKVVSVSPIPATPEGMQRVLKNSTLISKLTENGAPSQAIVALETDPGTASGYRWSTGHGPSIRIGNGTMADARIVTQRVRILSLVIPQIDRLLGPAGD